MNHSIKLNKTKQILGSIVSILFIVLATTLLINPLFFGDMPFNEQGILTIGITLNIIFLALLIFLIYKMITKQFGVIINEEGILDQSTAISLGFIKWEEIRGFAVKRNIGIPFIVVYLKDADGFLSRFKGMKKAAIKKNAETFNTPFVISTAMLDIKVDELQRIIEASGAKHNLQFE